MIRRTVLGECHNQLVCLSKIVSRLSKIVSRLSKIVSRLSKIVSQLLMSVRRRESSGPSFNKLLTVGTGAKMRT